MEAARAEAEQLKEEIAQARNAANDTSREHRSHESPYMHTYLIAHRISMTPCLTIPSYGYLC